MEGADDGQVTGETIEEMEHGEKIDLKPIDSDSNSNASIPPPPPPMVVPIASEESCNITEAERLKQPDEEQPLFEQKHKEKVAVDGNKTCCEKILDCLGQIPCPTLLSWIVLLLGLGCCTGGLLIATWRTRDLLDNTKILCQMEMTITGVVVGMFVMGCLLLTAGHLSTEPTSRRLFNSNRKNRCAQGLNILALVTCYILTIVWILVTCLLAAPVILLVDLLYIVSTDSLDPRNYGFDGKTLTGTTLEQFKEDGENLLITFAVALFGALIIVNSLICFIITISANITRLRDTSFTSLNVYDTEELNNSKHSVIDTNM
ncbi:uncharacterized protein LOC131950958 [Physella acuta]|uniref:uncharacterized protein LOC131950958 n=1 Tax=Physella acuta TaxID=109671 RepID=UPI0027DC43D5|nr:uncharacterized protein LOC131950958 [Physella acuta]XP_059169168.1 uncharacterized protein LOC131950958 [Physella acuta]XP_059169169.1 uncharacterized protein LOC131950958 [Physella acuta]